jgi:signal transduction histidine kinase
MSARVSYRSALVLKVVVLLTLGFLLISSVAWLYFRNEVRNIGYYLRFGKRNELALIIADYLGDPPSRLRARVLAQTYDLTILYQANGSIVWGVEKWRLFRSEGPGAVLRRHIGHVGMEMMMERRGKNPPRLMGQRVVLDPDRALTIYFPPPFTRGRHVTPLFFFLAIAALIGMILFLSLRRAFSPLDHILEASERIGTGDLSYRIEYDRKDDFSKVAAAFNTMATRLGVMIANQRELLHFISHELRTPLTRIRLALELKDRQKTTEIVRSEVHEIDSLIDAVSELSRLDSIDRDSSPTPVELTDLLQKVCDGAADGDVRFQKSARTAVVRGNAVLLEKALSNLIQNALKYSDGSEPVAVALTTEKGSALISVRNTGQGIPGVEQEKLWEPFFRGSNAERLKVDGRGLGLVVVKNAIELSRGSVTVESGAEGPTVFTVRLPLAVS